MFKIFHVIFSLINRFIKMYCSFLKYLSIFQISYLYLFLVQFHCDFNSWDSIMTQKMYSLEEWYTCTWKNIYTLCFAWQSVLLILIERNSISSPHTLQKIDMPLRVHVLLLEGSHWVQPHLGGILAQENEYCEARITGGHVRSFLPQTQISIKTRLNKKDFTQW